MFMVVLDKPRVPVTKATAVVGDYFMRPEELMHDDGIHRIIEIFPHGIVKYAFVQPDGNLLVRDTSFLELERSGAFYVAKMS